MPELEENKRYWDGSYNWAERGDEWSAFWGGPSFQWYASLLPRLQGFLPCSSIVEIAPGFGRWTHFLKDHCQELIGIDLSAECISACKERFKDYPHLSFSVNEGKALTGVEDRSVDLVFSYDSLVHVESDVIYSYLKEIERVLALNGKAFLHHSNVGAYSFEEARAHNLHWRGPSVSATLIREIAKRIGLEVISQEMHGWGGDTTLLTDCISVIGLAEGASAETKIMENFSFTQEMQAIKKLSDIYHPKD
jgi:ubiquinone/menaquinone biosynthesis C-methylase UbiE